MIALAEFERIVDETVAQLPEPFRARIDNLAIVVEEFPDARTLRAAGLNNQYALLGFYHGIPRTERRQGYNMVAPDLISIYRQPIMQHYRTDDAIRAGIRHTVLHELAHYFGIDDERLMEIGAY